jgi:hypothetical protein
MAGSRAKFAFLWDVKFCCYTHSSRAIRRLKVNKVMKQSWKEREKKKKEKRRKKNVRKLKK